MKKAFGLLELLIVIVVIIILYFTCFHSNFGKRNPFDDNAKLNSQQEIVDDKIKDIQDTKILRKRIEENLNKGY